MKNYIKTLLLMAVAAVALTSCATLNNVRTSAEQEYNETWIGKSHAEIVMAYGAPDRIESDGSDGQILVFEKFSKRYDTDVDTHFGMFDPECTTRVSEEKSYVHFFLRADGTCYLVRTNQLMPNGKNERNAYRAVAIFGGAALLTAIITSVSMMACSRNAMPHFAF